MRPRLARERVVAVVATSAAVGGGGGGISHPIRTAGGDSGGAGGSVTAIWGVSTRVVGEGGVVVSELGEVEEATAERDADDLAVDGVNVVVFPINCM